MLSFAACSAQLRRAGNSSRPSPQQGRCGAGAAIGPRGRLAHRHPARRADRHHCAGDLRALRRAPGRRRLRRHLGGRRARRSRTSAGFAARSSTSSASTRRSCGGPVAVSPTATTGATGSARAPARRAARTSGSTPRCRRPAAVRPESFRHGRVRPLLPPRRRAAVPGRQPAQPARARLLPVGRVLQLAGRDDHAWPTRAPRRARRIRSRSATGASATSRGAAAATSRRRLRDRVAALHVVGAVLRHAAALHPARRPAVRSSSGRGASSPTDEGQQGPGPSLVGLVSLHHYSTNVSGGRSNDWNESKGPAVGFTREQWFELLKEGDVSTASSTATGGSSTSSTRSAA